VNNQTVGGVTLSSGGSANTANVGNYSIVASNAIGGTFDATNYEIIYVNGTLAVNPAPLGISATGLENGSTTIAPSSYMFTGLQNGETLNFGTATIVSASPGMTNNYITALNGVSGTALLSNYQMNLIFNGTLGTSQTNVFTMTANPNLHPIPSTDNWVFQQSAVQGGTMVYIPLPKLQLPASKKTHLAFTFTGGVELIADQSTENSSDPSYMAQHDSSFTDQLFGTAPSITLISETDGQKVVADGDRIYIVNADQNEESPGATDTERLQLIAPKIEMTAPDSSPLKKVAKISRLVK
jgi:hypothetical protein